MPDLTDLQAVIVWLCGLGGPAVVLYAVSLLAENWKGWVNLPTWVKKLVPPLLAVLIAVGANILTGYTDIIAAIAPWWQIVISTMLAYLASQKAYMSTKEAEYGVRYKTMPVIKSKE